ncbi:type II secretion system F family protein [Alkaliphilus transvaalensis]|uniref:type II secretion system F family protein n=1 Tax=Alkaliphilus transvaalensis TaxID=114628 RepID=UPI0012EBF199|nr:type II secretion system F family protein [Alkaliphilus transvaalensis]
MEGLGELDMFVRGILLFFGTISLLGLLFLMKKDEKSIDNQSFNKVKKEALFTKLKPKREGLVEEWLYDYNQYPMDLKEKLFYIIIAATLLFIFGYIFYQNIIGALLLTPFGLLYPSLKVKEKIEKQKKQLTLEFKEALYMISSSLLIGKSLEIAVKDSIKEMEVLNPGEKSYITRELQYIVRRIEMNETVEEAFQAFASRSHIEDIESFVDILITCKRTGGNLVEVIRNTSKMITEKIEFQQELDLLLTQRKLEQKFLVVIPVALVLVLTWSAPDYMEPVFTTIVGKVVMTVAMALLITSIFISKKIIKIEV